MSDSNATISWGEFLATTKQPETERERDTNASPTRKTGKKSTLSSLARSSSDLVARLMSLNEQKTKEPVTEENLPRKEIIEKDAIFNVDPLTQVATLRACTLDRALDIIIYEWQEAGQQQFLTTFIVTYRFFTTPEKVFELLTKRFDHDEVLRSKQQTARLRVCIVLRYWLANYFVDFNDNLLRKVTDYITDRITPVLSSAAHTLLQIIEKRHSSDPLSVRSDSFPRPLIAPERWSVKFITTMPPLEVARQLTLIERSIFCQIKSTEWIKQAWLSSNSEQLAPNIVASVKRFNVVAGWIATHVLTTSTLDDRVRTIEYFIRLAQEFMTLQNYSGVLQVLSALQGTAVQRLNETWAAVDSRAMQDFHQLSELFQPIYNWRSARELLRRSQPPLIPFIGIYLTDLVYYDEALPDMEHGMINFVKFRLVAQTIQEIQSFQRVDYQIQELPYCRETLLNLHVLSTQELYESSYSIKPRPSEMRTDISAPITPSPPSSEMRRSWRELLEAAMLPEEDVDMYMQKLQASAIDINQVGALDKKILRDLGFKWGHILKILQNV